MKKFILTAIKGIAMGAADVVPGVSGGTIAFMTGIYKELIDSLKSIDHIALKKLLNGNLKEFWKHINGSFLVAVFSGVLFSIFTLARLMQYLLTNHPVQIWSFFFGLILASAIYILKDLTKIRFTDIIFGVIGISIASWISLTSPTETASTLPFIFFTGMIAICAMILPGISGSFILLLMGQYAFMMQSIKELNLIVIAVFGSGAIFGLLAFSHFLSWLLKKYYSKTIVLLSGFMIGSLIKVWPWKIASIRFEGLDYPTLPANYQIITGLDSLIIPAIVFMIIGFVIVFLIEFLSKILVK